MSSESGGAGGSGGSSGAGGRAGLGDRRGPRAGLTAGGALLVVGLLAVAFNMRGSIAGLPPVFPELTTAAGLSTAVKAALGAVPVLGFAAFSGLAPVLARKFGEERVLGLALALIVVGLGLRASFPSALLFPGSILAASAIAMLNVLLPSLIKRRRPDQAGLLIGLYLLCLTAGAVLASVIAVPLFNAAGGSGGSGASVRVTYGVWALPALVAAIFWLPQLRFRTQPAKLRRHGVLAMRTHALAWQVTAFMGLQSLSYYAALSWFPTMFRDHGISATSAGNLIALMNVGNAVAGLTVPMLAQRMRDQRLLVLAASSLMMIGLIGCAFAPNATVVAFVALLGLGQGASLGLSVFMFTARTADGETSAALSGFAQGVGYLLASAGPLLLGLLHTATGGWAVPAWLLLGVMSVQLVAGLLASRDKVIAAPALG